MYDAAFLNCSAHGLWGRRSESDWQLLKHPLGLLLGGEDVKFQVKTPPPPNP